MMSSVLLWLLSCSQPDKATEPVALSSNPSESFADSQSWDELRQLEFLRALRDKEPSKVQEFCGYNHHSAVEYECRVIENRPHLLDNKRGESKVTALWDIAPTQESMDISERFLYVRNAAKLTLQEIAAQCNAIDDETLRAECYFIAADALHHQKDEALFKNWFALCEASRGFKSYCFSHSIHRMIAPDLNDIKGWIFWGQTTKWLSSKDDPDVQRFAQERLRAAAYRSGAASTELCVSYKDLDESIGRVLKEVVRFEFFMRSNSQESFDVQLKKLLELADCIENPPKPSKRTYKSIPLPKGTTQIMLARHARLYDTDLEIDTALLLIEAAGLKGDRFLLSEGISFPNSRVSDRARVLARFFEQQ